ncbi:MAG: hypothetical protein DMF49_11520, partial [Acidobacteria bacterium]
MTRITHRRPTSSATTVHSPLGPVHRTVATVALALLGLLAASPAAANTVTKSSAGTCVDATGIGTFTWSTPANAQASDNAYSTAAFSGNNDASHFLKCTGFGFSLPSNSLIQGIQVEWEYKNATSGTIIDNAIRVVKGGTIGTTDKKSSAGWPATDTFVSYGGSSDLWGDSWTASDINGSSFGAALSTVQASGGSHTASVDSVRIT